MKPPAQPRRPSSDGARRPAAPKAPSSPTPGRADTPSSPIGRPGTAKRRFGRKRSGAELQEAPARPQAPDAASILGSGGADARDMTDRIVERKKARRRIVMRRVLIGVGVTALVAGIAAFLVFAPIFRLNADFVEVEGAGGDLPPERVHELVAPFVGSSIMLLPGEQIAQAVEAEPKVQDARVLRRLPDGIRVVVTQRVPRMYVPAGGGVDLIAQDGVTVGHADTAPEGTFEVVLPADEDERGEAAGWAATLWDALPEDIRAQVGNVDVSGQITTLHFANGKTIRWGDDTKTELKLKVLRTLMEQIGANVYDVSDPNRPVTSW